MPDTSPYFAAAMASQEVPMSEELLRRLRESGI